MSTEMTLCLRFLFLESMLLVSQVSAYINTSYGGYIFTTPDNTDINKRTRIDAVTWCANNGTKLLEIPSNDVQTTVAQYIQSIYVNGWNTVVNAKRYTQNWDWVNGQDINNLNVEQQSSDLTKSFGFLQLTATRILVAAALATDRRSYICEGSSFCTGGVMFQQRCYKSYTETLSWFDARNRCLSGGGDLSSFDFVHDSPGLSILNGTWLSPTLSYWVGIRRALWKWEGSATEVMYTQWVDGYPDLSSNYECICLYYVNWKWIMCDCGAKYQFICLTAATSSPTTKTTTASTSTITTTKTTTTTTHANMMSRPTTATTAKGFITVDNLLSTSLASSTVASEPESIPVGSGKSSSLTYNAALGIGLGIGIGGGLIISAIIVAVYIWAIRRGWSVSVE